MRSAVRWARVTGLITLALFLVSSAGIAVCLAYPNTLIPLAESLTEWALDRTLEIDGDLSFSLSAQPVIAVTNARLGNAPEGEAPYMVTADFAQAQIDIGALFDNRVHLLDAETRGASLHLEDPVDGHPNWRFFEPSGESTGKPWSFMIEQFRISDSEIHARIGELAPMQILVPHFEESSDLAGNLALSGHGEINDNPWRIRGSIGPFQELLSAGRINADLELMIDDAEIGIVGGVADLASMTGLDLALTAYGPDAELLGEIFRMPEAFTEDIALEAEIRPAEYGHTLGARGHLSDFEIKTAGTITDLAELDGWDGSVTIKGPELAVFGKALQIEGFPDGPFEVAGTLHLHGGDLDLKDVSLVSQDATLILNADFEQFPRREGAFGNFQLSGDDLSEFRTLLRLPGLPAEPFQFELTLDADGSEILRSSVAVGGHNLSAAGTLGEFPDFFGTELRLTATGPDLARLLLALEISQPLTGPYEADSLLLVGPDGLELTQTTVAIPGHQVRGNLIWPDVRRPGAVEFRGDLALDDLSKTAASFGAAQLPPDPIQSQITLRIEDGVVELIDSQTSFRSLTMNANGSLGYLNVLSDLRLDLKISGSQVDELFDDARASDNDPIPFTLTASITGEENAISLNAFELQASGGTFSATGRLALAEGWVGSQLELDGKGQQLNVLLPTFPNYAPPEAPWELHALVEIPDVDLLQVSDGRVQIGTVSMTLDGMLDLQDQTSTTLTFTAAGDSLKDIGQIGDVPWPDDAFDVKTTLTGTPDTLHIDQLKATWGVSDLDGEGSIYLQERPYIEVRGKSEVLDIYDLQRALFGLPEDEDPEDDAEKFFGDAPIPMHLFEDYDAVLDVQVDRFRGQRARLEDVHLELDIRDGVLMLNRAAYRDDTGYFDATGLLQPVDDEVYLEFTLVAEEVDTGLFTTAEQNREAVPRYAIDIDIWSRGRTAAELAADLNGRLLISSDGGEINNGLVEAFGGDFLTNVLQTMNPFVETEEFTKMSCLVLNASIKDGHLNMEPGFVMRTDRLNMFVYGGVDLERETLDLSLATQARQGIGISAASITNPYFKVGGTLVAPALQLDPASAAIAASVATATAGLSILIRGVFERMMGTRNPCPNFLEYEQEVARKPTLPQAGG